VTSRPEEPVPRITLGGVAVDLAERDDVLGAVRRRLTEPSAAPLLLASANLQHVGVFRPDGPLGSVFGRSAHEWLVLLDGAPLARRAARLTRRRWPRLTGADLLPDLLATAAETASRVGFLGGAPDLGARLRAECARRWPDLVVAGHWSPSRADLEDAERLGALVADVRAVGVALLVVGLGKPRQEQWLEAWSTPAGIRVGLAFGAAAEFLAGTQARAPRWARRAGVEWLWRLARDPARLARRYLVEGPGEWWRVQRDSAA
jgi:exopolysaccharide biosynthesis WecB/TagA/CpsF family protein